MEQENEDQKQFFKDLGATAERSVAEVREVEEDYYVWIQRMEVAFLDFNKKMQGYVEQNFAAAFEFAHEMSQAKDMQDFIRIYGKYVQNRFDLFAAQMKDFAETYTNFATSTIQAPRTDSSLVIADHQYPTVVPAPAPARPDCSAVRLGGEV